MEGGEGNAVSCGHNGVVWLEVTVHGRAAHGSMPENGINALEKMSALVLALEDYKRILARRTFLTPEGRTMKPTLNVGGVFTCGEGAKVNTVPAHAAFTIDRRVLAIESHAEAERDLRAFLKAAAERRSPIAASPFQKFRRISRVSINPPIRSLAPWPQA